MSLFVTIFISAIQAKPVLQTLQQNRTQTDVDASVHDASVSSIAMKTTSGVDLQHLPGSTPDKYALNLLDAPFH